MSAGLETRRSSPRVSSAKPWVKISLATYSIACLLPALTMPPRWYGAFFTNLEPEVFSGLGCLIQGMNLLNPSTSGESVLLISWLGNIGWPIGMIFVTSRAWVLAFVTGVVGLATCLLTLLVFLNQMPVGNKGLSVAELGPGYVLWTVALALPLIASLVEWRGRKSASAFEAEAGDDQRAEGPGAATGRDVEADVNVVDVS